MVTAREGAASRGACEATRGVELTTQVQVLLLLQVEWKWNVLSQEYDIRLLKSRYLLLKGVCLVPPPVTHILNQIQSIVSHIPA